MRLAFVFVPILLVAACTTDVGEDVEDVDTTSEELSGADAVARAMQWVKVKLHYCWAPNGKPDPNPACASVCRRVSDPDWDPYRSDCSGLVSWAWGLPAPGRVTSQLAPFRTDVSYVIDASALRPGDAVNSSGHVMLFAKWLAFGKRALFLEEPGCSSSRPYARETTSDVSLSGSSIHVSAHGRTFVAIRRRGIEAPAPPPPKDEPPRGSLDEASCAFVSGRACDPDAKKKVLDVVVAADGKPFVRLDASCDASFRTRLPLSLADGEAHVVDAYVEQGAKRTPLSGGRRTVRCAPPPMPGPPSAWVRRFFASEEAVAAWKIDAAFDVAREPASIVETYPLGSSLGQRPLAVRAEGSNDAWVIDGVVRRRVLGDASLASWHLRAQVWTESAIDAIPEGPAWPRERFAFGARPAETFVLDVADAPPNGADDARPNEPEAAPEGDPGEAVVLRPTSNARTRAAAAEPGCALVSPARRSGARAPFAIALAFALAAFGRSRSRADDGRSRRRSRA